MYYCEDRLYSYGEDRLYSYGADHLCSYGLHSYWTSLPGVFLANGALALGAGKMYHPKVPPAYDDKLSWSDFEDNLPFENPCWNTANFAR